jgi:hypothetical protein
MTVMAMILYSVSANIPMPVDTDVFYALKEKSGLSHGTGMNAGNTSSFLHKRLRKANESLG